MAGPVSGDIGPVRPDMPVVGPGGTRPGPLVGPGGTRPPSVPGMPQKLEEGVLAAIGAGSAATKSGGAPQLEEMMKGLEDQIANAELAPEEKAKLQSTLDKLRNNPATTVGDLFELSETLRGVGASAAASASAPTVADLFERSMAASGAKEPVISTSTPPQAGLMQEAVKNLAARIESAEVTPEDRVRLKGMMEQILDGSVGKTGLINVHIATSEAMINKLADIGTNPDKIAELRSMVDRVRSNPQATMGDVFAIEMAISSARLGR